MQHHLFIIFLSILELLTGNNRLRASEPIKITGTAGTVLQVESYAEFNEPWAMTFLPGGAMLVTEKPGSLLLVSADGQSKVSVNGIPNVAYGGQGGLGDVILHPDYEKNKIV